MRKRLSVAFVSLILVSAGLVSLATAVGGTVHEVYPMSTDIYVYPGDVIQDAIDDAGDGDVVIVHPGVYHQSVVFYDPGDDGVTLTCLPGAILDGSGDPDEGATLTYNAITIQTGVEYVTIEGCEIRNYRDTGNGQGNAIEAWNDGTSHITVRDNTMHNFSWNAVLVGNEGQGLHDNWTISDNTIYDADAYTLECTNCVDSVISGNIVTHSAGCTWGHGITISAQNYQTGTTLALYDILIEDNLIDGTDPDETAVGIYVIAWSPGTGAISIIDGLIIEDNIVTSAKLGILAWSYDPANGDEVNLPMVTGNVVSGTDWGIRLRNTDGGTVSGNVVTGSDLSDIQIHGSDDVVVSDNVASSSDKAIEVKDSDNVDVDGNVASDATYGIWIGGTSSGTTVENNVASGNTEGIKVDTAGSGISIFNNVAESNTFAGVYVLSTDGVSIRYNVVTYNEQWGILLESSDSTMVDHNTVTDNIPPSYVWPNGGIGLLDSDYNDVEDNDVIDNWMGIYMENSDSNEILDNYIFGNNWPDSGDGQSYGGLGIAVWEYGTDRSDYNTIEGNWIEDHDRNAVLFGVAQTAGGFNTGNIIRGNTAVDFGWYGLELTNSQDGVIEGNTVYNTLTTWECWYSGEACIGILVQGWGSGGLGDDNTVERNTVHSYITQGIRLFSRESATADDNIVTENHVYDVDTGIKASTSSSMADNKIEENIVLNVDTDGICLYGTTRTTVKNNQVKTGGGTGIYDYGGSFDTIESNRVSDFTTGIHADDTTNVDIIKNVVTHNDVGVLSSSNSDLTVKDNSITENVVGVKLESDAMGDTVENNVISKNTDQGILVLGNSNIIFRNVVNNNDGTGIKVEGNSNTVKRNVVNNNDNYGIWVTGDYNRFERNVVRNNTPYDVRDDGTGNEWIRNNIGTWGP